MLTAQTFTCVSTSVSSFHHLWNGDDNNNNKVLSLSTPKNCSSSTNFSSILSEPFLSKDVTSRNRNKESFCEYLSCIGGPASLPPSLIANKALFYQGVWVSGRRRWIGVRSLHIRDKRKRETEEERRAFSAAFFRARRDSVSDALVPALALISAALPHPGRDGSFRLQPKWAPNRFTPGRNAPLQPLPRHIRRSGVRTPKQ